jgi:hypothetical protein
MAARNWVSRKFRAVRDFGLLGERHFLAIASPSQTQRRLCRGIDEACRTVRRVRPRIETTTNDVSFFKHHRRVEHRNSPQTRGLAPVKKTIYSRIDLREILHLPVECWQPVVSASARGLDFMVKHGIKGAVGGGAATMEGVPITGYRDAAARAGKDLKLGEDLMIGLVIHLADTQERAMREIIPLSCPFSRVPDVKSHPLSCLGCHL